MGDVPDGATLREALLAIARNFSFTWTAEARALFDVLDPERFAELHHNPTALLSELTDANLAAALTPGYLDRLARVQARSGLAEDEVRRIFAAQATPAERRAAADDLVDNGGSLEELHVQVHALHRHYLELAATAR